MAASLDVLIVSYNTRDLLRDCLASIRRNAPDPASVELTVSVLDNASSDGSADMVASEFPDVRLVRSGANLGFGAATNRLCSTSSADHLMPLNPDTIWRSDVATPLLRVLRSDDRIAVVGPRLVWPDGRRQLSSQGFPSLAFEMALALRGTKAARLPFGVWDADAVVRRVRQEDEPDDGPPRDTDFLWATCWVMRSADVPGGRLFDDAFPMYDEDLDLCMRLRSTGRRIVYVPRVELVHLGGASSTPEAKLVLMRRARVRFHRRHGGPARAAAFILGTRSAAALKAAGGRLRGGIAVR